MKFTKSLSAFAFTLLVAASGYSQLTVQTGITPTNLVQNVLVGSGTSAFNITSQGQPLQFGKFFGFNSNLGLDSGVVLSTALLTNPLVLNGPAMNAPPQSANTGGHPLLNQVVSPYVTYDAALITFQFIPTDDTLMFDYIFASEEYHVYVNSSFNDVFGFFLTGPNPFGPNYNNTNIARVPGTSTPVTINTVNNGQTFNTCTPGTSPSNSQYFVDNCQGTTVCYNGFTVPLTALAPVVPCSTYTITLAVANTSDHALQSAVFLEANSFQTGNVQLSAANNTINGQIDTALFEGCGTVDLLITRTGDLSLPFTAQLTLGGTATNNIDYTGIPDSVVFLAGQDTQIVTIQPIWDMIPEGTESITITVTNITCFSQTTSTITFLLYNTDPLAINAGNDTVINCLGGTLTAHVTGGAPDYNIQWSSGTTYTGPNMSLSTNIIPTQDGYYYATVTDVCNNTAIDSVFVDFLSPVFAGFSIDPPSPSDTPIEGCGFSDIVIHRTEFLNMAKTYPIQITGTATNGADYNMIPPTVTFPPGVTTVTLNITPVLDMITEGNETVTIGIVDTLCDGTAAPFSETVTIRNLDKLDVDLGPDIVVNCPRTAQNLIPVITGGWPQLVYTWDNGYGQQLDLMNMLPPQTTVYVFTIADSCGYTDTDSIEIFIPIDPVADFDLPASNCVPQNLLFLNTSDIGSGNTAQWEWEATNGATSSSEDALLYFPQGGTFDITLIVTNPYNCKDSVTKQITVYPLPTALGYYSPQNPTTLFPQVSFWDESQGNIVDWSWNVGGNSYSGTEFDHYFEQSGVYPVILVVTTVDGCTDTMAFDLIVKDETAIHIPNTFTPDGNELNEFWGPIGSNWDVMELRVFDRWGEEIFFSDKKDYFWNGKKYNSGDILKQDTYVYKVYIIDTYGNEYNYYGHVNLLR